MLNRAKVIKIGNELIKGKLDYNNAVALINAYVCEKDKSKENSIMQTLPHLPQELIINMVKVALDYFMSKYEVFSLCKKISHNNFIINGVPQTSIDPIYYY